MSDTAQKPHRFGHEAMHTVFTIFICGEDAQYASSAAQEAFRLLDNLEEKLSRFIPSSEVSRVNNLRAGECHRIDTDAWECLGIAAEIAAKTHRAFDPVAGALIDFWKNQRTPVADPENDTAWKTAWEAHRRGQIALSPETRTASCVHAGSKLDLGAIAKGYALDRLGNFLEENWKISSALLSAGGSTVLALDAPPDKAGWKIGFGDENLPAVSLRRAALSSTGTEFQATHLVDPRTGDIATRNDTVRSLAPTAAEADALSTAFFVLERDEIVNFCKENLGRVALFADLKNGTFDTIGEGDLHFWEK